MNDFGHRWTQKHTDLFLPRKHTNEHKIILATDEHRNTQNILRVSVPWCLRGLKHRHRGTQKDTDFSFSFT